MAAVTPTPYCGAQSGPELQEQIEIDFLLAAKAGRIEPCKNLCLRVSLEVLAEGLVIGSDRCYNAIQEGLSSLETRQQIFDAALDLAILRREEKRAIDLIQFASPKGIVRILQHQEIMLFEMPEALIDAIPDQSVDQVAIGGFMPQLEQENRVSAPFPRWLPPSIIEKLSERMSKEAIGQILRFLCEQAFSRYIDRDSLKIFADRALPTQLDEILSMSLKPFPLLTRSVRNEVHEILAPGASEEVRLKVYTQIWREEKRIPTDIHFFIHGFPDIQCVAERGNTTIGLRFFNPDNILNQYKILRSDRQTSSYFFDFNRGNLPGPESARKAIEEAAAWIEQCFQRQRNYEGVMATLKQFKRISKDFATFLEFLKIL